MLRIAIITLSDRASRGEYEDKTGPALKALLEQKLGGDSIRLEVIPDEASTLEHLIKQLADIEGYDLIVTNGSTGVSPRDIAPEALLAVIERRLPGFEEEMRRVSREITIKAIISRAVCGIRANTLIISVPGSPKGAVENLGALLGAIPHAIDKIKGDPSECAGAN
ncbi:MAG: MogA/MoaB family molybdenum cofactor biosynthesis protein [Deferribacteraceae bacterium]|jgi:molybdenum cofactor synthesis domain-containing protein|nr:MogA/MoaB family molybdenum cofactor biosynthesis protein [Deferribacteraceae bacterium]